MKKYLISIATALAALSTFTACEDNNDCGCECNVPVISRIEYLDQPGVAVNFATDSLDAGTSIVVMGSNLGNVTAVKFDGKDASLKPAYRTDNSLVFTIPSVSKSCKAVLYTASCQTGFEIASFNVKVGAPEIYMVNNEFAADGTILKIKGVNFVGDSIKIGFGATDAYIIANGYRDSLVWVSVPSYENTIDGADGVKDADGTELWVTVPAGVIAESHNISVKNSALNKMTTSPIRFRDTRNMLANFETRLEYNYHIGLVDKNAADGSYDVYSDTAYPQIVRTVPTLYHDPIKTVNQFGILDPTDFKAISYVADGNNETVAGTVFGSLLEDAQANPEKYCVKFEVYVPEEKSVEGASLTLGFQNASSDPTDMTAPRSYAASVNFSKISWNSTSTPWSVADAASFSTDEWMTVTVPFTEFLWNFATMNYVSMAQNFVNSKWDAEGDVDGVYGDGAFRPGMGLNPTSHWDYVTFNNDLTDPEYWSMFYIIYDSYDAAKADDEFLYCIDNVRIVKYDGNGAIYPKTGYGVPSQSFTDAPRTKAYTGNN